MPAHHSEPQSRDLKAVTVHTFQAMRPMPISQYLQMVTKLIDLPAGRRAAYVDDLVLAMADAGMPMATAEVARDLGDHRGGSETGALGFQNVGAVPLGKRLGHLAAAGVADTNEEDFRQPHERTFSINRL